MTERVLFERWVKMFNPNKLEWIHFVVTDHAIYINGVLIKER